MDLRWYVQRYSIRHLLKTNITLPISSIDRVIVIAPHADDELIGCYGLLTNKYITLKVFYCSLLGSNYSKTNHDRREEEFLSYMSNIGREFVIAKNDDFSEELEAIIREDQPQYIFLPAFIDWHDEHRLVNLKLYSILNRIPFDGKIGWYNVSIPIPGLYTTSLFPISRNEQNEKWDCFEKFYSSQKNLDICRFKFIEANCRFKKLGIAEKYIIMDKEIWFSAIKRLRPYEKQLSAIKKSIGDIKKMFVEAAKFYSICFSSK